MPKALVERTVDTSPATTSRGVLERLFAMLFNGLVYSQVWEDPDVDLAALAVQPHHTLVTISSAGCNVLNYLAADPARVIAVDINPHHLALSRLKLASLKHLPSHEHFFRFWGSANSHANLDAYDTFLKPHLDPESRRYWERRPLLGRRRVDMFARHLYHHGVLGRGIGLAHRLARLQGKRLEEVVHAPDLAAQRRAFERIVAPLFDNAVFKALSRTPVPLFVLGIPPAQYDELLEASGGDMASLLRRRVEQLACGFPASDNYFAWQVFARGYDVGARRAIPPYLRPPVYELIRRRTDRVEIHHASLVDFLRQQPAHSIDRFILLDAQDWMTSARLAELWQEINRTAAVRDARVIFRTAGVASLLPRKLAADLFATWEYREGESRAFHARDRPSIFGGFHLYTRPA